jgi:hypothetical protein
LQLRGCPPLCRSALKTDWASVLLAPESCIICPCCTGKFGTW